MITSADYIVWRNNRGTDLALLNRNPALGRNIGQADYDYWIANFTGAGASNSTVDPVSVPEPATDVVLCMVVLIAMGCGRGRARVKT